MLWCSTSTSSVTPFGKFAFLFLFYDSSASSPTSWRLGSAARFGLRHPLGRAGAADSCAGDAVAGCQDQLAHPPSVVFAGLRDGAQADQRHPPKIQQDLSAEAPIKTVCRNPGWILTRAAANCSAGCVLTAPRMPQRAVRFLPRRSAAHQHSASRRWWRPWLAACWLHLLGTLVLPARSAAFEAEAAFLSLFSTSAGINSVALARFFLFGARDVLVVVAVAGVPRGRPWAGRSGRLGGFMGLWVDRLRESFRPPPQPCDGLGQRRPAGHLQQMQFWERPAHRPSSPDRRGALFGRPTILAW